MDGQKRIKAWGRNRDLPVRYAYLPTRTRNNKAKHENQDIKESNGAGTQIKQTNNKTTRAPERGKPSNATFQSNKFKC